MRQKLILHPHPTYRSKDVSELSVGVSRARHRVRLDFTLEGNLANLALPPMERTTRGDRLWEHCCFEAFVKSRGGTGYLELNFAPSGQWAAYDFFDTRKGKAVAEIDPPTISIWSDHVALHLTAEIEGIPFDDTWSLAVSAVIEEKTGALSYWALAHPSAKPDFHHPRSFVLTLP